MHLHVTPAPARVLGTGYLGATHAACMAELGYEVLGLDVDAAKVDRADRRRGARSTSPASTELLRKQRSTRAGCASPRRTPRPPTFGDVHFLCVGTPQQQGRVRRRPDATSTRVVDGAGAAPRPADASSSASRPSRSAPPRGWPRGCAELAPAGDEVELAWNPEFLREGFAVEDTLHPDRLVFGVAVERGRGDCCARSTPPSLDAGTPVVVTDFATAELVKVAANAFLATKISFINAMAEVCEADRRRRRRSSPTRIGYDDRIGRRFLNAGLGFGGGCLPKDIRAFMARAGELGVDQALTFLREVDAINLRRRGPRWSTSPARLLRRLASPARGSRVLGAAFKPNSDDIRDSPALDVAGADRSCRAPQVHGLRPARRWTTPSALFPTLALRRLGASRRAGGADVVLHLTEWREFREHRPGRARRGRRAAAASSTAATPSTRRAGAPPAGPTAPSAAPSHPYSGVGGEEGAAVHLVLGGLGAAAGSPARRC